MKTATERARGVGERASIVNPWTDGRELCQRFPEAVRGHSVKRIDIHYGGDHYSVGGRALEALQQEIAAGLATGVHWLEVNEGEGSRRQAFLLLTPGVSLAIVPVPEHPAERGADTWNPGDLFET